MLLVIIQWIFVIFSFMFFFHLLQDILRSMVVSEIRYDL